MSNQELSKWELGTRKALGLEWAAWDALFKRTNEEDTKQYCLRRQEGLEKSLKRLNMSNLRREQGIEARKRRGRNE